MTVKRVLIVATWFPTQSDPVGGIFVEDQAKALATRFEVAVIAPDLRSWRAAVRGPGLPPRLLMERRRDLLVARPGVVAVATRRLAAWSYRRAVERAYVELEHAWGRPDVIHAHVVLPGGWSAVHLGRRIGVPVVLTEHSSPFAVHLATPWQRSAVRWTLEHVDATIAVSEGLRAQIRAFANVGIDVVGNVSDAEFFSPVDRLVDASSPRRPYRFLTVGILTPQKGVDILLESARRLIDQGQVDWELVVGGDGPSRAALEAQAADLGLRGHCRFVGRLSRAETRDWMRWADVFVLASRHETFGMVVLEALLCDKPVIVTRSGGPEFIVTPEVSRVVEPGDVVALAGSMAAAIHGDLRPRPGMARSVAVDRYGTTAFLRAMTAIYQGLA